MENLNRLKWALFAFVTIALASCSQQEKPELYPNEHFYNQRAYPNNYISPTAIIRSRNLVKQKLSSRSASTGTWQLEGPINIGGRVTDLAISPVNNNHLYLSAAVGGVFRSYDQGDNWEAIFDEEGKFSIGNIAIAPSDPSRIYVGTGEANASATSGAFFGDGIYRSDNGGDSWQNIGLPQSQHIGRIVVDPNDPDRVFVAATGTLYGKNLERGVYRTEDGGANWDHVLFLTDSTACIDVAMNPVNPDTLYAAMWERVRYPWIRTYGGFSSGVYRSTDGGDSWQLLTNGLPAPDSQTGRIGLAVSHSNPNIVYASYTTNAITNEFDALYRSVDNGSTWTEVSGGQIANANATFGWYFGNVRVKPHNPNSVMVLGQLLYQTQDSGNNWDEVNGMHVDHHAMEFSLTDTNLVFAGGDGGAYLSYDGGNSWSHFENLPITQFYNIEVDHQQPERIYGGTQDNNTIRTLTGSDNDWHAILGGDGFHVIVDPTNSDQIYAEYQWGNLFSSTDGGFSMNSATSGIDENDRTNWNTPVVMSPFDSDVLFYGSNRLYMSFDNANWWDVISPDLTDGQHPSGSLSYGTLTAIAASYNNLDVIYTGSDDGNVSVTFDGGANWNSIDAQLPNRYVSQVAIHPEDDLTAYVTFSGFSFLDYTPHIYKTVDGGQNWTDISSDLPDVPLNDVKIWNEADMLFVASDMGVWYTENDGLSWDILGDDLPMTIVANLKLHEPTSTLYAGTFGRSIHSYDLAQINPVSVSEEFQVGEISLYPNPSKGFVNIEFKGLDKDDYQLIINDINGKNVLQMNMGSLSGGQLVRLDLTALSKGMYSVNLISENGTITRKLIKE